MFKEDCCGYRPHDARCPYSPDDVPSHACDGCGEEICEGDGYYEIGGESLCEGCIEKYRKIA